MQADIQDSHVNLKKLKSLKNINIEHLVDSQNKAELKFQISGDLQTDQSTEPVSFLISSESDFKDYPLEEQSLVG